MKQCLPLLYSLSMHFSVQLFQYYILLMQFIVVMPLLYFLSMCSLWVLACLLPWNLISTVIYRYINSAAPQSCQFVLTFYHMTSSYLVVATMISSPWCVEQSVRSFACPSAHSAHKSLNQMYFDFEGSMISCLTISFNLIPEGAFFFLMASGTAWHVLVFYQSDLRELGQICRLGVSLSIHYNAFLIFKLLPFFWVPFSVFSHPWGHSAFRTFNRLPVFCTAFSVRSYLTSLCLSQYFLFLYHSMFRQAKLSCSLLSC